MFHKSLLRTTMFLASFFVLGANAEEKSVTEKAESMASQPVQAGDVDITTLKRARVSEEQAVAQLKFMMIEGWKRMEEDLLERGSFKPFGLTLSPQGEFRPLYLDTPEDLNQQIHVDALVKNLKAIAQTRSVWCVGMMYVTGNQRSDGTYNKRIAVVGEHIAGVARAWSYPYKIIDGEVKLGTSKESEMEPVYFK